MSRTMDLLVNGVRHTIDAEPDRTLLTLLRDELEFTGTKYGCGEGQCGACTVLFDGAPPRSCQTRAGAWPGTKSRPSKVWNSTAVCILCRKRFSKWKRCSAATARRA